MMRMAPGSNKAFIAIGEAPERARTAVRRAFYFLGKRNVKLTKLEMRRKNKTGRIYLVRLRKGAPTKHQASAPGEYPAKMTGALVKSLDFVVKGSSQMEFGSRDIAYAQTLQDGRRGHPEIKPRPFLTLTAKATEKDMIRYFEQTLNKELNK